MKILLTNDDGVHAPGLLALAQEMRLLGDVRVLAPDRNWSASGHAKTMDRPLRVRETRLEDGSAAWCSDGAPSDCVALALLGLFDEKYDLVLSGINPSANLGQDVTYSGTVTAAMEAVVMGVPGIAVSLQAPNGQAEPLDYGPAARAARQVAEKTILPPGIFLSLNVPYLPDAQIRGLAVTRQGRRVYHDTLDMRRDPRGRPYYWIGGDFPSGEPAPGSDIGALAEGYVSVTPLQLDLTAHGLLGALQAMLDEKK